jgi:sugar phosphate isomerase/epimerase
MRAQEATSMRFAISGGVFPAHIDEFTEEHARNVRALGFTGCFTRFDLDDPFETSEASIKRVRAILDDHDLEMVQAIGHRPPLIHPDETIRREGVRVFQQALRIAGGLRAHSCHSGPGSMAQQGITRSDWVRSGAWNPHPRNWDAACKDRLIASLKECAKVAEDFGTRIGLEGHVLVTLSSAETMRDVIDAVGSPAVGCDLDPVNWLRLETVYDSGPAIEHMIDVLGPQRILNAHSKDVVVLPRLVTHIDECTTGDGILDHDTFMRRMEALGSERYLIVEHCSVEDIPRAKAFLDAKAKALGIKVY